MPNCEQYRKGSVTLQIRLSRSHVQLLAQEQKRMQLQYGVKVSKGELVEVLVEQHRMRIMQVGDENPETLIWFYRKLKGLDSD